jgi:lipoprotein NlpD
MRIVKILILVLLAVSLGACNKTLAPVEDRSTARTGQAIPASGYYRVKRGDSLHAIAFNYGLDWRDIARWNEIRAPYVIHPDQTLRLSAEKPRAAVTTRAAGPPPTVSERAVERSPSASTPRPAKTPPAATSSRPVASTGTSSASSPPKTPTGKPSTGAATADPSRWLWPVEGRLLSSFKAGDPTRNGIEISGTEGQAIRASAAGEVVYSGSGLIGYGELIIVKHSDRMLSAYAHNRKRLVAEGQAVSAGEKIAEMGRDERNRSLLHFEIRRNGTPQDPMKYLSKR